ncbi:hypothetical protein LJR084_005844 [Variovorax sp. LjRoot84]|uniref:hypothetical protein n=1 Tax=Variovorax sp. LjRoot84 TaxID=3342340 RepID=UPI003ED0FBEE
MSTLDQSSRANAFGGLAGAFKALADEASVLVHALLNPGKIFEEVEQMRALHLDANKVEASNPARAAALRWQASRVGLR